MDFAFVTKWQFQPLYPETSWGMRGNTRSCHKPSVGPIMRPWPLPSDRRVPALTADIQARFHDLQNGDCNSEVIAKCLKMALNAF